jgi:hypothetical protein
MKTFIFLLFINSCSLYATIAIFCYEDRNFPPYIFSTSINDQPKGLMIDLISLSAKDAGIYTKIVIKR